MLKSPLWPRILLVWLYDEHGGNYDHVAPPAAIPPDDIAPMLSGDDPRGGYDIYGPRVPAVVVSGYAQPHAVTNLVHDVLADEPRTVTVELTATGEALRDVEVELPARRERLATAHRAELGATRRRVELHSRHALAPGRYTVVVKSGRRTIWAHTERLG